MGECLNLATDAHSSPVVVTTLHALSISLTCFRLWYRTWKSQLWWEDCWAGIALVAETISLVRSYAYFTPGCDPSLDLCMVYTEPYWYVLRGTLNTARSITTSGDAGRIIAVWNLMVGFTICLWCVDHPLSRVNLCRLSPQVGAIKYRMFGRPSHPQRLEAAKDGDRFSCGVYHHVSVAALSKDILLCT